VLQAMFMYARFVHAVFGSAPLPLPNVVASMLVGAVILPVVGSDMGVRRGAVGAAESALSPPASRR